MNRGSHFGQVVRRDARRHTDGNAVRAVQQQVWKARRQYRGFLFAVVEVRLEGDRILSDVFEHVTCNPVEPALRVSHSRGWVAIDAAEVALAVHQRVAQGEILSHPDHGLVNRRVAVGVVFPHHFTDRTRRFRVLLVVRVTAFEHPVEHTSVHGLEPVTGVGEGPTDDHRHGVVDVRRPHFLGEASVFELAHWGHGLVFLVLRCQGWSPPSRGSR